MKQKHYNIIYAVVMILIVLTFIIFNNLDDTIQIILGSLAIILTAIFTSSNNRSRKK